MARERTFVGIDIGDAVRKAAATAQHRLAKTGAEVKWVPPANMHLTLAFLGDLDDRELPAVCKAVGAAAKTEDSFRLAFGGLGAFPSPRRPKVLWTGITDGIEPVGRLFAEVEKRLAELGVYRPEERPYTPHLTLGRIADEAAGQVIAAEFPAYAAWNGGETLVTELLIYNSELRRDGPEYATIGRGPLRG